MIVYNGKLLKKSSNQNSQLILSTLVATHGFQTSHFICDQFGCKLWLLSIQNYDRHRFPAFSPRHLKSLFDSNMSICPVLRQVFDLDMLLCTDSIRNTRFCSYVIFVLKDQWSKDWAKRWALLWSATTPRKCPVFVPAQPARPSCAWARPQDLGHWFCSQNFRLSSGMAFHYAAWRKTGFRGLDLRLGYLNVHILALAFHARWLKMPSKFGSDCHMTFRGSNLDSNLNSAAWPIDCRGFICSKTPQ